MATGDASDIAARLARYLPPWFPTPAAGTVWGALGAGAATVLAQCYALLAYVRLQTRIATATDGWLDIISLTYFGTALPRRASESDSAFRTRIQANLILERVTRRGMIQALTMLTGKAPVIFEPARPGQAFCLGVSGLGTGRLGSYLMNNQALITAYRPVGAGGANVAGLGSSYAGLGSPYLAVLGADQLYGAVHDSDIYATVDATQPAASVMWVNLQ